MKYRINEHVDGEQLLRALARQDCPRCNARGIEEGHEFPLAGFGGEIARLRDSGRVCACIPRVEFNGSPVAYVIFTYSGIYESVEPPIGISVTVVER